MVGTQLSLLTTFHMFFFQFIFVLPQNFFLSPTNTSEKQNVSLRNSDKSVGPNNIPMKILKSLRSDISSQLADIFNISFSTDIFPTILKVGNVVPVYRKTPKEIFKLLVTFTIIQY